MTIVAAALLIALGFLTYRAVESSLRELRAGSLKSLLDSEVNALELWVGGQTGAAERAARDPRVRKTIGDLARAPRCSAEASAELEELLRPLLQESGDASYSIVDPGGRVIATRVAEHCGARASPGFLAELEPVFGGKPRFVRPFRDAERADGAPLAWISAPVFDERAKVIAALGIAQPVDAVFGSILRAAQPGKSGEAYAFDARGAILTGERFGAPAPLPAKPAGDAREGVILDPYVNHRGAEVIAAWRWLPDYGMGVALEMEAAEAYAPLRYLNTAFSMVFGALVVAVFAALVSVWSMVRLRKESGRRVGAYRLGERIGEGGMANVYLARHDLLKRPTAIKLLKPARATDEIIARFEREVQLASSLSHPNTVEIFDYGRTREGLFYYAMEYLDGMTVSQLLERQSPLPVPRVIHLLQQVCAALAEAHARDIVHRDIKPENVMVCRHGGLYDFVKILDFGLVKHVSQQHSRDLTRNLRILGTPLYMAPERLRDPADVDARADVYAVGALAFLMLTGRKLFDTADDLQLTSKILNEEPPRAAEVAPQPIPRELDLIVTACVEKKRELRPSRMVDLVEAFAALAAEHRWTQREAELWWSQPPKSEQA